MSILAKLRGRKAPEPVVIPVEKPEWEKERDSWCASRGTAFFKNKSLWPNEKEWPVVKKWVESKGEWPDPQFTFWGDDSEEQILWDYLFKAKEDLYGKPPYDTTIKLTEDSTRSIPHRIEGWSNPSLREAGVPEKLSLITEDRGKIDLTQYVRDEEGNPRHVAVPPRDKIIKVIKAGKRLSWKEKQALEAVKTIENSGVPIKVTVPKELRDADVARQERWVYVDAEGKGRKLTKKEQYLFELQQDAKKWENGNKVFIAERAWEILGYLGLADLYEKDDKGFPALPQLSRSLRGPERGAQRLLRAFCRASGSEDR